MSTNVSNSREAVISADKDLPKVTITREFDAPPEQVFAAHIDPEIFAQWIGPDRYQVTIDRWDGKTGGSYRYSTGDQWFFGSFHEVLAEDCTLVQTWSWEGMPGAVSLETMTFTELPGGRSLLTSVALVDSMEAQAGMLASGMETGINQGYAKLDAILAEGQ
ncbi:SRPBCC domain-containing protein [Microlunatus soli]|uniref:Uncharacterized conserved protein YndB, AHSA1/START domain n=1 Tax=Microlunatus soli TaxID=630515 RepID=A0A1H1PQ24_9ACTN|nr:SRPBCC domain-containing protein [Microlunatus soli]SDS13173.1 Uncharacterized conserved protein YndB, AHSA1/START domain [Microlunatus soli]